jgi:hypothetical protein
MTNELSREEELIGKYLDYEIKMLHETRKALSSRSSRPVSPIPPCDMRLVCNLVCKFAH